MANAMPEYGGTVLRPGASGPDIALVQRWLGGLNVDGRYGTSTETAVRRFQREQGLKIDGHVGRDTWDALYRAWADKNGEGEIWPGVTMRRGSRGATVKSAQQKLKTLVPELTTDGRYGASTREAVLAWQVVHDLKPEKIEEKDAVENGRKYHVTVWRDRCEICGECFEPYENKEYVCDVETGTAPTTAPTTAVRPTTAKKPEKTTCVGKGSIKWAKNIKRCKIKLKLNKVAGAKGYQIRYATNKKFKKAVIRNSKLSYIIKKLKKGKTYYVEARAYVKSGKNRVYGKWSKTKKVKIKK